MATWANDAMQVRARDSRFFEVSAILMALILAGGFSLQLAMGRSTFGAPLFVHVHGVIFFGWVLLYVAQTFLGTRGPIALHRRLGWLAAGWVAAMVVAGFAVIIWRIQAAQAPFFFRPQHFLIANPLVVLLFSGLTSAAVAMRKRSDWHRRLHLCAMAALLGPGFGRLLPMPLMIPWAYQIAMVCGLMFPIAGMIRDMVRNGRVHRAWWWGIGTILAVMAGTEAIVYSPLGDAIYSWVTAGTPGATVAPLEFGAMPPMG
jgi:hypothetical protein